MRQIRALGKACDKKSLPVAPTLAGWLDFLAYGSMMPATTKDVLLDEALSASHSVACQPFFQS